jgi:hypothetical protein
VTSIRTLILTGAVATGLVLPTAAFAGQCKVAVVEDGKPMAGVMVEARTNDGQHVAPVKTDEEGMALLQAEADKFEVAVQGMPAGGCMDYLMADIRKLKEQREHGGTDPNATPNNGSGVEQKKDDEPGATPEGGQKADAGQSKSGTVGGTAAQQEAGSGKTGGKAGTTKGKTKGGK